MHAPADFDPWDDAPAPSSSSSTRRKRPRRHVENDDFIAFARRILRAAERRAGDADPEDFAALVELRGVVDEAIDRAAVALYESGRASWTDIARPLGISRQAARQRWGRRPTV